jgi:hypothetical protein
MNDLNRSEWIDRDVADGLSGLTDVLSVRGIEAGRADAAQRCKKRSQQQEMATVQSGLTKRDSRLFGLAHATKTNDTPGVDEKIARRRLFAEPVGR